MPNREKSQRDGDQLAGSPEPERAAGRRRRRGLPGRAAILAAIAVGVVIAMAIAFLQDPSEPEITMVEVVSGADPEIAAVAHEAAGVVNDLLERHPGQVDGWHVAGDFYYKFGKLDEAVKCWKRCLELDPGASQAHFWLGAAAADRGLSEEALESFRKALERTPSEPQVLVRTAQALIDLGETDEAIQVLEKNLAAYPRSLAGFVLLGEIYGQSRQFGKAKEHLRTVIEMRPNYTTAYYGLAMACAGLDQEEESKRYMEKFKELNAADEQAHRDWLKTGDDLPRVRKNASEIFTGAAKAYLAQEDPQTAETLLLRAVELCPSQPECHQVLAWLYERQGRIAEAHDALARGSEANPDDLGTHLRWGAFLAGQGKFDEAEKALGEAIRIMPYLGGGYAALARLHLTANRKLDEANELATKAVELEPLAKNYFLLAVIRQRVGDHQAALAAIEKAVSLEPGNPEYRQVYVMIQEGKPE